MKHNSLYVTHDNVVNTMNTRAQHCIPPAAVRQTVLTTKVLASGGVDNVVYATIQSLIVRCKHSDDTVRKAIAARLLNPTTIRKHAN